LVDNDFLQQTVDDADFSPNWYNSMSQIINSPLPVQPQSSGQNSRFDLNTPINEEEEESIPQLQTRRHLPPRTRKPLPCGT
jgi:hypothetical protein